MAFERTWAVVPPQPFTANGNTFGAISVADTAGFRVKQSAYLQDNTGRNLPVQVKRVLSPTLLVVGSVDNNLASWKPLDISSWTTAVIASIGAQEQPKVSNPPDGDHYKAIYEADPVVADRVIWVDQYGNFYNKDNPLPIAFDGTISIGVVEVKGRNGNTIEPNDDGSLNVRFDVKPPPGQDVINQYGEANSVASGATTNVVQYTFPIGKTQGVLQRVSVSGENVAKFTVFLNGIQIDTRRTFYGNLNEYFEFITGFNDGVLLSPGDTVLVKVLHNKPYVADFEGRIQVLEIE